MTGNKNPFLAERRCPKCGVQADEHWNCCEVHAETIALALIEECARVGYRVCAETRHVTLGDKVAAEIRALASAKRVKGEPPRE